MADNESFDQWAVLEIMGHVKLAGRVREHTIAGAGFVRIDVPRASGEYTRFFSTGSIYSITPCSEDVARRCASTYDSPPIQAYELPEVRRLEHVDAPTRDTNNDSQWDDED